mmetsp:Transcript_3907/g.6603  ORF Transcript_3907/g.6603 Transcript_3907/m.6603 type:complete len:423 (+) Transcript_3907:29-1297(+)
MTQEVYDCIVVGLGAHGSSCLAQLAKENAKVLGLEKFTRGHTRGSSHGRSRVIRQSYFEDPRYVPLVKRSFEMWRDLAAFEAQQRDSQDDKDVSSLLNVVGGLMIGHRDSEIIAGTLAAAEEHSLPHETLTAQEMRSRFPALTPGDDMMGVYESEAGYLIPEACLEAHFKMAEQHRACLRFEESMASWQAVEAEGTDRVIVVTTDQGNTFLTKKLVLSVGAWAPEVYGHQIPLDLQVERRVLFWFQPGATSAHHDEDRISPFRNLPIFLWDASTEEKMCQFYGFPSESHGAFSQCVKIALHQAIGSTLNGAPESAACTPDSINRHVCHTEVSHMQHILEGKVPALASSSVQALETCLYTNTSDEHFLIDFLPENDNVIIASPCSGHGFKFSSVIGEILKELVLQGESSHDISLFSIASRKNN